MLPKSSLGIIFSILLILLASIVLIGWWIQSPLMVQILPGMIAMVPNTAICFIFLGTGFILQSLPSIDRFHIKPLLFTLILIICTASLFQDIFNYRLGIDQWAHPNWLQDPNPTPGRMAPNTAIGFMLSAIAGLILPHIYHKKMANLFLSLIAIIFLLALVGLLVYSLKLEFIFSSYKYTRMAIHTSIGFFLVSFILWQLWSQSPFYPAFYEGREDKKIIIISGILLLFISLISGLGSIASLTYINLMSFHQMLSSTLFIKINVITQDIQTLNQSLNFISQNPLVAKSIVSKDIETLQTITQHLDREGYAAIRFEDKSKKYLIGETELPKASGALLHLNLAYPNTFFWDKGLWLQFIVPIKSQHAIVGFLSGKYFLSASTKMYLDYQNLGETGEMVICQHTQKNFAECLPSRLTKQNFQITLVDNDKPKPMAYAIKGITGMMNAVDYRNNNVAAAFAPIDNLGIGMVLKMESTEIYTPLRNNLLLIFPIILVLISCGLILLRWQVAPLVKKVVEANLATKEANKQLSQKNLEIHFLRDLSSALQESASLQRAANFISQYGENILPNVSATLFIVDTSQHGLKVVASWGDQHPETFFAIEDCYAAGMKRPHHMGIVHQTICKHIVLLERYRYSSCIPLLLNNVLIGILSIHWGHEKREDIMQKLDLAVALSEQLALGISNIQLRETLTQQSIRDPLTGLYNRRYLEETIERELDRAKRGCLPLSVLILDIDKFKTYNDTYGHKVGDYVLQQLARLLTKFTRLGDIACRYGGEEFVIVLINTSNDIAYKRAEQIRQEVSQLQPNYSRTKLGTITVSIGVATYPLNGMDMMSLIHAADKALYQAKNLGRNKVMLANQI